MPLSVRGTLFAWLSATMLAVAIALHFCRTGGTHCVTISLFAFSLLAAAMTSFSRYMDSRTRITISPFSIAYQSPLRNLTFDWNDIRQLRSVQAGHGWRLTAHGEHSFFSFRVPADSGSKASFSSILALPKGAYLAQLICGMAKLSDPEYHHGEWICQREL